MGRWRSSWATLLCWVLRSVEPTCSLPFDNYLKHHLRAFRSHAHLTADCLLSFSRLRVSAGTLRACAAQPLPEMILCSLDWPMTHDLWSVILVVFLYIIHINMYMYIPKYHLFDLSQMPWCEWAKCERDGRTQKKSFFLVGLTSMKNSLIWLLRKIWLFVYVKYDRLPSKNTHWNLNITHW